MFQEQSLKRVRINSYPSQHLSQFGHFSEAVMSAGPWHADELALQFHQYFELNLEHDRFVVYIHTQIKLAIK